MVAAGQAKAGVYSERLRTRGPG